MLDRPFASRTPKAAWLMLGLLAPACAVSPAGDSPEPLGSSKTAVFVNGDFESGTNDQPPPFWTVSTYLNNGITLQTPQSRAGLNLVAGGEALTRTLVTSAGPESQADPFLGATASLRWPKFGNAVAIVNQQGAQRNVNSMSQTMTVTGADVDSLDGLAHIRFVIAPVLQDAGHAAEQQPYFFVQLTNISQSKVVYRDFNFANQPGVPWKADASGTIRYTDWALVDIAPGSASLAPGDQVQLEIIAAGCSQSAHFGQVYVDGVGTIIPGLLTYATAPAAANQDTNITYVVNYKNGSASAAGGVTVAFNTPPNTTFASYQAPGLTCTAPAPGATGLVSCTIGALPAGAGGSLKVTAHINNGIAPAVITAGNYYIQGTNVSPLLGPKVKTNVTSGVTYADLSVTKTDGVDTVTAGQAATYTVVVSNAGPYPVVGATVIDSLPAELTAASWTCTGSSGATCTAIGTGNIDDSATSIPAGGSLTYTLQATVNANASAGLLANSASVTVPADATDPAPANNAAADYDQLTVANGQPCASSGDCVSGVCDNADFRCGFADGDGPCSHLNGDLVCRSGACSINGLCMPAGGCNHDGDCTGGSWCMMSTHACTAKVANGGAVPADPPHVNPTLDGTCTVQAAFLVCASAVCDTKDNLCGYADGTGPCDSTNADRCRSGACSSSGVCMASGKCLVDADCSSPLPVCDPATSECVACLDGKVAECKDATPICDTAAKSCVACSADFGANTPTACPAATAPYCASSGACGKCSSNADCAGQHAGPICNSSSGACGATCAVDADCPSGNWCDNPTANGGTCTPKLPNGEHVPKEQPINGECDSAVGQRVCVSAVCEASDDRCGMLNGSACTKAGECRSDVCHTDALCGLPDGSKCTDSVQCRSAAGCQGGTCGAVADAAPGDAQTDAQLDGQNDAQPDSQVDAKSDAPEKDAATGQDAAMDGPTTEPPAGEAEGGGCSCTTTGSNNQKGGAFAALALALVLARRRRSTT